METDEIDKLPEESFRRLTGVRKKTFFEMRGLLEEGDVRRKARGGKPQKTLWTALYPDSRDLQ